MHILYTATAYPPSTGGAQTHMHLLACELARRHVVQVVSQWDTNRADWLLGTTLRAPATSRAYRHEGIAVHRLGLSVWEKLTLAPYLPLYYPLMDVALPPIVATLARHMAPFAARADLIHNVRIGREGLSRASFDLARRRAIPFVLTPVHHPRWVGWRYRAYLHLYREADAVIALTDAERRVLVGLGVREERIAVTGHAPLLAPDADGATFRARHGLGDDPVVLFLGQHYGYKGFRPVLEAAPLVWRRAPETRFVFIGPPVKDSERAFAELSDPRVLRLGTVSLQEKTDALAACTLLCVPSMQESFGGVYTEAWSFGRPVIGCPIPAVAEVVADGEDGLLVPQQPGAIADAVLELLADPARAAAMGAAGKHKVAARYTWPRIAALTEQVYTDLLCK